MINAKQILTDLQKQQKKLEADLREQIDAGAEIRDSLNADYQAARASGRTSETFNSWCSAQITQAAVAWILGCVFLRFVEDNQLIAELMLAGPGDGNRLAREAMQEFFQARPLDNERHYLQHSFTQLAQYPAVTSLYDPSHNLLFALPISYDAAKTLVEFWQRVDPDTGELAHDFTDPQLDTRFLGDLYQDLSESARKRYALLQTPEFVEEFILDRTLDPAIETFGLDTARLIDPTCGSGHFLLGAFQRLLARWQQQAPALDNREWVKRALAAVYGVDINPFAVAIARFRLLVAALQAAGIKTLKEAPGWRFNVTAGDSLLHGRRFNELDLGSDDLEERFSHVYVAEDKNEIDRILGQQYHAVVGNPPYITVKDKALNQLYRTRYSTCHMKYSLGVPFTERFFQLSITDDHAPAGFVGLINTNGFIKREYGRKLIEEYLPRHDLTHVIDTSGAYIPGHGTPTVILFARQRQPIAQSLRAVLGIRGEPTTPDDAANGFVWSSIEEFFDHPGTANDYISVADIPRDRLAKHPWSLQGGVSPEVLEAIVANSESLLSNHVTEIGFGAILGEDDAFMLANSASDERRAENPNTLPLVEGEVIRDWDVTPATEVLFPYDDSITLRAETPIIDALWPLRTILWARNDFSRQRYRDAGRAYWSYHQIPQERNRVPRSITFAFVATHNHFVLDRGGRVFNRSAPIIKLPAGASDGEHLGLVGLLNSSTACFWMQQVFHNKGGPGGGSSKDEKWHDFYEHDGTKLKRFPLPDSRPLNLATKLDTLSTHRSSLQPSVLSAKLPLSRDELNRFRDESDSILCLMIAYQEELDWWGYAAYGLLDEDLTYDSAPLGLEHGQRSFEIVLARRMASNQVDTIWFKRHGSTPITDIPERWPADYHALVQKRIDVIETNDRINLLERPEYKRRWNQPSWDQLEQAALRDWLLDRLETARYWPEPVLRSLNDLAASAERDDDFMAVGRLYTDQVGFDVRALLDDLINDQSVPALKTLRYKTDGLRKRRDWEITWDLQREEDSIDAAVASELKQHEDEPDILWEERLATEQKRRKDEEIGDIPAPPKYKSGDFLKTSYWRLRGGLDVPKECFFCLPGGDAQGQWLYGWAGWNAAERVRAIAGTYLNAEQSKGWPVSQLIPLLAAVDEALPWVLQWHNDVDVETGVRLGNYFRDWLGSELQKHGLTHEDLQEWRPEARSRRRRAAV